MRILVYGIGNPGRQDDALGIMLAGEIETWAGSKHLPEIHTEQNYQLNIEDAELISLCDLVIFADASMADIPDTLLEEVKPNLLTGLGMHSVEPAAVAGLCQQLYSRTPLCYQLHIRGYGFDFMKPPTRRARANLRKAFSLLTDFILRTIHPD